MSNENLQNDVLNFAVDNVKDKIPDSFAKFGTFGADRKGDFGVLGTYMMKNGAISDALDVTEERKNASRATAFATSVLTSLYMTDKVCENIDEFCDDPKNKSRFQDMSTAEKEAFRQEMKDKVRNNLAVEPKTEEGKQLVEKLTKEFTKADFLKTSKEQALRFKKDGIDVYQMSTDMFGEGMAAIYALNNHIFNGKSISESAQIIRDKAPEKSGFYKLILDSIESDSKELAGEEEVFTHVVKQFSVEVNNNFNVNPNDFLKHYENGTITPEEKGWAMNLVGKMGLEYDDFKDLKVDGKPMFEGWQLHKEDELDRAVDVVAAALSIKEVTHEKDNKETMLNPQVVGQLEKPKSKGIIDTIIQFFKSIVGGDSFKKEQNKISDMSIHAQMAKTNYEEKHRQRLSFAELSGLNSVKKMNTPTGKQNTLSEEKKGVSRGR